jgi:S1-C subfamily serine protease
VITFFNPITFSFLSAKIILSKAEPCGVLIGNIIPNSPAEQIGIEPRSTILYINGKPIYNVISLGKVMEKTKPGDILRLKLVAPNGSRYERTVVLTTSPKQFDVKGGFLGIANLTISIRPYCKFSG